MHENFYILFDVISGIEQERERITEQEVENES